MNYKLIGKIVDMMPKKLAVYLSHKIVNRYLNKYANITITGLENIQNLNEPVLFVCNHLSNADGLVLAKVLKEVNPTFVSGVKLSDDIVTKIGMNVVKTTNIKPNSADLEGIKRIITLVKGGESILIFPEGTRSRVGKMIEGKKGVQLIAKMTKVSIVPIGMYGTEKLMPINVDGNMASESFKHADVFVNIGEKFNLPTKSDEMSKRELEDYSLNMLMKNIAELLPIEYRGVYE